MTEFICPKSQQACSYGEFCEVRKFGMEVAQSDPSGPIAQALKRDRAQKDGAPNVLIEAQGVSYCSDERIEDVMSAASEAIRDPNLSDVGMKRLQKWAAIIAGGIMLERRTHMASPKTHTPNHLVE